jgi:acetolactate decarboxylase
MKRFSLRILVLILSLFMLGLAHADQPLLYQVSTITALKEGCYDGPVTFGQLKEHGDFGLGTLNGLDGEMIALDGRFFQVSADGSVREIDASAKTPFAAVCTFRAEKKLAGDGKQNLQQVLQWLDEAVPDQDRFLAIRIDGTFPFMKVRSVPRQAKPYPKLTDALKHQTVFELTDAEGTMVGFRCPPYAEGINVGGYHFHFINRARTAGGHVLDCRLDRAEAGILPCDRLMLQLIPDASQPKLGIAPRPANVVHE